MTGRLPKAAYALRQAWVSIQICSGPINLTNYFIFFQHIKTKYIQAIEDIQRTFTYKITEVQYLNYWERLHELKLYSLQRRRERYIIIYIWKITQHMVPNIEGTMGTK